MKLIQKEILLRKANFQVTESYDSLSLNNLKAFQKNDYQLPSIHAIETCKNDNKDKVYHLYFFRVLCGIRVVSDPHNEDETLAILLEAMYEIGFESETKLSKKELENVPRHYNIMKEIWPYWKEHVVSTCTKAGFSPLALNDIPELSISGLTKV